MAATADAPVTAHKVPKAGERMTYRQEMDRIKYMPRLSRLVLIMKVASVAFFAIGLEGLVSWNEPGRPLIAFTFITLALVVNLLPMQVRINVCARCGFRMDLGQAICPRCGVPNM
ncbi:MAG TPA: hypothetical protein VEM95_01995 [Thermoplasmata archaeon]|nr:hypothetical protein [Thermoplasmata archaeon]